MNKNIGKILKEARILSGVSVKEISDILVNKGYKASESTIYSWENENSQPTPGAFLVMCGTYGIKNVLDTFGYNGYKKDGSIQLNMKEIDIIEKYRFTTKYSPEGITTVDTVLNREYSIAEQLKEQKERIEELESETSPQRIIAYYQRLASAGSGDYLFDDIPTDFIRVKSTAISRQADFVIGVNGRSMEDTYHDGDRVFVKKLPEIDRGDIGVFTRGNDCFIKELGTDRLISHNQDKEAYPDIPASNDIRLVGKVLGLVAD
jgi:Predicted transcriptional regulator